MRVSGCATKDPAGGHYPSGLCSIRTVLHARAVQAGLLVGGVVPVGRGVFHLSGLA